MVRASLRKARTRKVNTRKPKAWNDRTGVRKKRIRDEALKEVYDPKKTMKQNLASTNVKEMYLNRLPAEVPTKPKHPTKVGEEEAPICEQLDRCHGDDYEAMHWDIKVNVFQWTVSQCKKKVLAWKQGKVRSMAAEILSGHGQDLRKPIFGAAKKRNVFGH